MQQPGEGGLRAHLSMQQPVRGDLRAHLFTQQPVGGLRAHRVALCRRAWDRNPGLPVRLCTLGIIHPHTKLERNRTNRYRDTAKRTLLTPITWHVPHSAPISRMGQLLIENGVYRIDPSDSENRLSLGCAPAKLSAWESEAMAGRSAGRQAVPINSCRVRGNRTRGCPLGNYYHYSDLALLSVLVALFQLIILLLLLIIIYYLQF